MTPEQRSYFLLGFTFATADRLAKEMGVSEKEALELLIKASHERLKKISKSD
ncbi:RNA polymerase sigma factor [Bacillus phage 268TH004]|uniref:RNA polymerase sigma factor n=1 Tax=Bacillus phage 268TH004 TaxID=2801523 RepID=A0A7T8C659_9CAUD|nr:RNA polymerase sigma factor [Bacillus phage 276BB001]QFG05957.1 RNA polymerase sigma factor [Bacillus phage 280BB001]QQO40381.1 RNA polymerase sigma factor [Bacillus phage 268TH004]QZA70106.1 RNA polymerase sigma factor [Bacillus phage 274BB002]